MGRGYPWPEEIKAEHRRLYDTVPQLSHSQIGRRITEKFGRKMTRCASIGLSWRNNYPARNPQNPKDKPGRWEVTLVDSVRSRKRYRVRITPPDHTSLTIRGM